MDSGRERSLGEGRKKSQHPQRSRREEEFTEDKQAGSVQIEEQLQCFYIGQTPTLLLQTNAKNKLLQQAAYLALSFFYCAPLITVSVWFWQVERRFFLSLVAITSLSGQRFAEKWPPKHDAR